MKKWYALLVVVLIGYVGIAQIINIPDANFKAKLLAASPTATIAYDAAGTKIKIDTNGDGDIQVSEALNVYGLIVGSSNIADLTGISYFHNLVELLCENNSLTSLDVTGLTNLWFLYCPSNQLNTLTLTGLNLDRLDCGYNNLSSIDIAGMTNLTWLTCSYNNLSSLNVTNLNLLQKLYCQYNHQIVTLAVGNLHTLTDLDCSGNAITSLDVSQLVNLRSLNCDHNQISLLNTSGLVNLTDISCNYNLISSLNLSASPNLTKALCYYNQLSSLNVVGLSNLLELRCYSNQLSSLDTTGLTSMTILGTSSNQLTNLDVSTDSNLQMLNCQNNLLTSILLSPSLHELRCFNNLLSSLSTTGLVNLTDLECNNNQLTDISLSDLSHLETLYCYSNHLSSLHVGDLNYLTTLICHDNLINSLEFGNVIALNLLDCSNNQLPNLNFSNLTNLAILMCGGNQITTLNLSGLNLRYLSCNNNLLTTLNLSSLTNLSSLDCSFNQLTTLDLNNQVSMNSMLANNNSLNSIFFKGPVTIDQDGIELFEDASAFSFTNNDGLEYICTDEYRIPLVQNKLNSYGYTNCHVNSYCSFTPGGAFYTIQGNNHYDSNNNGCDASDISIPNQKLTFSNGTASANLIADTTGAYRYDVQAGTQTFTPTLENPAYFTISPTTATVTFPTTTSPFTQDFCIAANGVHNDLEVAIFPVGSARPGFDATYQIVYKNKGTAVQSGTLALTYAGIISSLVSATPTTASQATNTLNWNFTALQPFETRTIWVTLHIHSPTDTPPANAGNGIIYVATVTGSSSEETPADNTVSFDQTLVNSFDPNEKTCTEGQFLPTYNIGKYLHYVIHFENTGTAAAQHIVVKDIIDTTKFDISTLVPLTGSANFTTRITNTNQVEFIFQNINLPFAAGTNEGYVGFKVKTLPSVVEGDIIANTANIYFDYNAPITTNTNTVVVFNPLTNADFTFEKLFTIAPIPTKDSLAITVKGDAVISSVSIYNALGQLVQVNAHPNNTIDVSGLRAGTYFITISSDKVSATGKFIKE